MPLPNTFNGCAYFTGANNASRGVSLYLIAAMRELNVFDGLVQTGKLKDESSNNLSSFSPNKNGRGERFISWLLLLKNMYIRE